jgi:isochorismate hydrolase
MARVSVPAAPYAFECDPATTALLVIDMQRDFVEPAARPGTTAGHRWEADPQELRVAP